MEQMLLQVEENFAKAQRAHREQVTMLQLQLQEANQRLHAGGGGGGGGGGDAAELRQRLHESAYYSRMFREAAKGHSARINTMALEAEKQLQALLQGCAALKEVAVLVSSMDRMAPPYQLQQAPQ